MWNPFHGHDFPLSNNDDGERDILVGEDWACQCGKNFFVFTYRYDTEGTEWLVWREAGKFK